jgi:23S rRNA pseudouridine2605 synthase
MNQRKKQANPHQQDECSTSLIKFIAQAGICSRRKAEKIIRDGFVSVNGIVNINPWEIIHIEDNVYYQNTVIKREEKIYILLNKPGNVICSTHDPEGRKTVIDCISLSKQHIHKRLYHIGRLDRNSTGLIIITNDGDLTQQLAHPKYEITKIYAVTLDKPLHKNDLQKITHGLQLNDGFIKVDSIEEKKDAPENTFLITLHSGKNRIIRRIFEALNYKVNILDRIQYGPLVKAGLEQGDWRYLTTHELTMLFAL